MKPSEALAAHREEVLAILARYPVANPRIFGSVARGEDKEGSDIDIVVDALDGCSYTHFFRIEDAMKSLLRVEVDLHTMPEFGLRMRSRVEKDLRPL
ncbi:MAG: nucleotidyltransferase family protein [Notoacmeibacter sp.]|nr:nucleotidyltransferase family protein [Notoacmeibacter sp.]MCC0031857.1 nucleotidyltransferase family protein [Brucellaceae bacterium]